MLRKQQNNDCQQNNSQPLNNLIHIRIMDLTGLLYLNNNKFANGVPTEEVFKQILQHLYNCYDQLDAIFINQLKEIPLYIQEKIIRQNFHKLFSVNKYLFKNIRNWFQGEYFQTYKKGSFENSFMKRQDNNLNHLCTFCRSSVQQINLKQVKRQILGGYELREQFEKELSIQKMQEQIEKKAYSLNILEYNNSVNYLTKLINEMEDNARSYHVMVQKVETNTPISEELGLKSIIQSLTKIMDKLSKRCRIKLVQKIKKIQKTQQQIIMNTHKIKKLSISIQVNQFIRGAKSKKIIDSQQMAFKKLKQQYKVLQSQFTNVSQLCENYRLQMMKLGKDDLNKDREIQNLLGTVLALQNISKQKLNADKLSLPFKYKQKLQGTKLSETDNQKELLLSFQRNSNVQNFNKKKILKSNPTSKMKLNKFRYSQLIVSQKNEELMDGRLLQNNVQVLKQADMQEEDLSSNFIPTSSLIHTKTQLNIKNQAIGQASMLTIGIDELNDKSNKMISTKIIYPFKIDVSTQWEEINLPKIQIHKQKKQKPKIRLEEINSKEYKKHAKVNIKKDVQNIKGERQLNKTVNINDKSIRFTSMPDQMEENSKQISKSIKTLKSLMTKKKIDNDDGLKQKPFGNKMQDRSEDLIKINHIETNMNIQKYNGFGRSGQFMKVPIHQFKMAIEDQIAKKAIIFLHQEQSANKKLHDNSKQRSNHKDKVRFSTQGNESSMYKKPRLIRNILFKPEHLMLFGGVSESFAYQNMNLFLSEINLSTIEKAYLNQIYLFIINLKQFKMSIYENVVLFLKKPYQLIDRNENVFKDIESNKLKGIILKFIIFHRQKCKKELCEHLINFGNIIGFNFIL